MTAARNLNPKRLIAIFQPHRYTRTKLLLDDFTKSFDDADCIVLTDIYAAGESQIEGLSAENIANNIKHLFPGKSVTYLHKDNIVDFLIPEIKHRDLIITLGAGDITKLSDELALEFEKTIRLHR